MNDEQTWDENLRGKERLFVLNYCTQDAFFFNGTQSYIVAYTKYKDGKVSYRPDDNTAGVCASQLLRRPRVKEAIKRLLRDTQPEVDSENSYRLLHDLVIQATFNPADIIDKKGQLKVKKLEDLGELAKCVEQVIPTQFGTRIVLAKRSYAQEKLLKYYDLIRETPEIVQELPVVLLNDRKSIDDWNKEARA